MGGTGWLKYKAGATIGGLAVKARMAVETAAVGLAGAISSSLTGILVTGLIVGGIVAIAIGVAGAYSIYYIGCLIDDG